MSEIKSKTTVVQPMKNSQNYFFFKYSYRVCTSLKETLFLV